MKILIAYLVFAFPLVFWGETHTQKKAIQKVLFRSLELKAVLSANSEFYIFKKPNRRAHSKACGTAQVDAQFSDGAARRPGPGRADRVSA